MRVVCVGQNAKIYSTIECKFLSVLKMWVPEGPFSKASYVQYYEIMLSCLWYSLMIGMAYTSMQI